MDGSPTLPPEQLRFNVSKSRDVGEFLKVGKRCADELGHQDMVVMRKRP